MDSVGIELGDTQPLGGGGESAHIWSQQSPGVIVVRVEEKQFESCFSDTK